MIQTTIETITPELAKEYLRHNGHNRRIRPSYVETLVRDIKAGKFTLTHQGIGFRENGELFDGQHRLLAIAMAGIPVQMMVSRDVPDEAVLATDRGQTRTVCDVIRISDQESVAGPLRSSKIVSALSQLVRCNYKYMRLSASDVMELYNAFPETVTAVYESVARHSTLKGITAPMLAAAIAAVDNGVDKTVVEKFFRVFGKDDLSGCENMNVQAALNWKRQIDAAKIRHMSIDRKNIYLGTQQAIRNFSSTGRPSTISVPDEPIYDMSGKLSAVLDKNVTSAAIA